MFPLTMKLALVGVLGVLANLKSVAAHGHVQAITVDDAYYYGYDPTYPPNLGASPVIASDNSDNGFKTYNSTELGQNGPDTSVAALHAAAKAGSVVTWFWQEWPSGHRGPVTTYMAACPTSGCSGYDGNTATNWFKTGEYGIDAAGMWGSDYINSTNSLSWQFTIPEDIPQGYYLLRHEIIAMHTTFAPQFYPIVSSSVVLLGMERPPYALPRYSQTMYIALTSSGTASPSPLGSFPDMYSSGTPVDDALTWNIYGSNTGTFAVPGVALYSTAASGSSSGGPVGIAIPSGTPITTDATVSGAGGPTGATVPSAASSVVVSASATAAASATSATLSAQVSSGSSAAVVSTSTSSESVDGVPASSSSSVVISTTATTVPSTLASASSHVAVTSAASPTALPASSSTGVCTRSTVYVTVTEA